MRAVAVGAAASRRRKPAKAEEPKDGARQGEPRATGRARDNRVDAAEARQPAAAEKAPGGGTKRSRAKEEATMLGSKKRGSVTGKQHRDEESCPQ